MYSFIDVEASGFGSGSYPIEVGVALADGRSECTLIRPQPDWQHWDPSAQALHQISRETLLLNGRSPLSVAMLLNEWLAGQVVYSDAWGNDSCWLAMLFDSAGITQRFRVDSVVSLLSDPEVARWDETKSRVLARLRCQRHRASTDARVLQLTFDELQLAKAV